MWGSELFPTAVCSMIHLFIQTWSWNDYCTFILAFTKRAAAFNHIKSSFSHHLLHLPTPQHRSHPSSLLACGHKRDIRKEWDARKPNQNNLFLVTFRTVLGLCLKHFVVPLVYFPLPPQPKSRKKKKAQKMFGGGVSMRVGICKPAAIRHFQNDFTLLIRFFCFFTS